MDFQVILIICSVIVSCCHGDYTCLCNYNVEIPVYSGTDRSAQVLGYMYEFDCKNLLSYSNPAWSTIEFEHQIGFIESNGQVKIQTCPGDTPEEDRIKSTSFPISTVFTTKLNPSQTTAVASSFSSAKVNSLPLTSNFHPTSLSPPVLYSSSLSATSIPTTTISLSNISSDPAKTSTHKFSAASSTISKPTVTSLTYTFLKTKTSPSKILNELSTENRLYGLSTMQFIGTTMSTKPRTSPLSNSSLSKVSTLTTPIIPFSSWLSSAFSTNLISSSVSKAGSQTLSAHISKIQSRTTFIASPSSTSDIGKGSTPRYNTSTTRSSTSVPSEISTLSSESYEAHSKSSSLSSRTFPRQSQTSTTPKFTNSLGFTPDFTKNLTATPDRSRTPSHNPSSLTSVSVSTHVPLTIPASTSDQKVTKNFTRITEKVPISDRVDLCPYKNLAMSMYNFTTFTYPLFRQYGDYCYELRLKLGNWFEAQRDCVSRGGELVVIQNMEVQARVYNLTSSLTYKTDVWIGLHDLNQEGQWEWVSGDKMTNSNFNRGILINPVFSDAQDCVLMDGKSGIWKNTACKTFLLDIESYPWVCQYKVTSKPIRERHFSKLFIGYIIISFMFL